MRGRLVELTTLIARFAEPFTVSTLIFVSVGTVLSAQPASLWVYDTGSGAPIISSPTFCTEDTVYIGDPLALYAVTNSGNAASNKWVLALPSNGGVGYGSPAIGSDGTIYIAGGSLCAVRPNGTLKWAYPSVAVATPAIGRDNNIYIQGASYLYAITPEGTLRWSGSGGGGSVVFSSAVAGSDGSVYIASGSIYTFYALNSNGTDKWSAPFGEAGFLAGDSAAIGADGTIYATSAALYAFSREGNTLWVSHDPLGNQCYAPSPSIGKNGTIYVATSWNFDFGYGFSLYAIDSAAGLQWNVKTNLHGGPCLFVSSPAIDSAGNIILTAGNFLFVITSSGNVLYAFHPGQWSQFTNFACHWT
jgi:hypothetical protein